MTDTRPVTRAVAPDAETVRRFITAFEETDKRGN